MDAHRKVEYVRKIEEKVKAMQSEINVYKEPTVTGRKPQDSNNTSKLFGPEGKNKHSIRTEGRNKNSKNEERLGTSRKTLNITTSKS